MVTTALVGAQCNSFSCHFLIPSLDDTRFLAPRHDKQRHGKSTIVVPTMMLWQRPQKMTSSSFWFGPDSLGNFISCYARSSLLIAFPVAAYAAVCAEQLLPECDTMFCYDRDGSCNSEAPCCPPWRCMPENVTNTSASALAGRDARVTAPKCV